MREGEGDLALPILGWGIAGGLVGSLSCCCWLGPAAAGWIACRQVARARPEGARGVGLGVGVVSAVVVSSLGTALFLATSDPELLGEVGAGDLSLGALAVAYATFGFGVSVAGSTLGGLFAAGSPEGKASSSHSALRFLDEVPASAVRRPTPAPIEALPPTHELLVSPPTDDLSASPPTDDLSASPPDARTPRGESPVAPAQNGETPAAAGALDVDATDLTSSDDEQDAWD